MRSPSVRTAIIGTACAAALLFVLGSVLPSSGAARAQPPFAGSYAPFVAADPPTQAPDIAFVDADGAPHQLSDYRGKVVLLNFWATWCLACIVEMPALDRLQAKLGGEAFVVVALSQDAAPPAIVRRFLQKQKLDRLGVFMDPRRRLGIAFGQDLLPTSVLLDAEGREVGRLVGPAEWDSPEAVALIRDVMRRGGGEANR